MDASGHRLVLASSSPQRLLLLNQIGLKPVPLPPLHVDESPCPGELPRQLVLRLAALKAYTLYQSGHPEVKGSFILSGDTVLACGRRILNKPKDEEEARHQLTLISGRRLRAFSGFSIMTPAGKQNTKAVVTRIAFKSLTPQEIKILLACGEWKGTAGSCKIDGRAAAFVKAINGSFSNVVGLPLYEVYQSLCGLGFKPLKT